MSWEVPRCEACDREMEFEQAGPFTMPRTYAVAWTCPGCGKRFLDVCAVGPDVPGATTCLNCGSNTQTDAACPECGMTRAEIEALVLAASQSSPPSVEEAAALSKRGLVRLAFNLLDTRLLQKPQDPEAWTAKGNWAHQLGLHEPAVVALRRALSFDGGPENHARLGLSLAALGRHEEAITAYHSYLELAEGEHAAAIMSNIGNSLAELERWEEAEAMYRQAIKRAPEMTTLRVNHYVALKRQRRFEEAKTVLDEALEHASADERPGILHERADTLCELERGQPALADIEEALQDDPDDVSRNYVRGWALGLVGRLKDAHAQMQRVLQLDPEHAAGQRALRMLEDALPSEAAPDKKPWWKVW